MATRDFDAGRADREFHRFTLGGENFLAKPSLPFAALQKVLVAKENAGTSGALIKVYEFFDMCLVKNDRQRFRALLDDEDSDQPVEIEVVMDIVEWLVEVYTGKRSGQPPSLESGLPNTTPSSVDDSSSPGSAEPTSEVTPPRTVRL